MDLSPHHSKQRSRDGFPFFTANDPPSYTLALALFSMSSNKLRASLTIQTRPEEIPLLGSGGQTYNHFKLSTINKRLDCRAYRNNHREGYISSNPPRDYLPSRGSLLSLFATAKNTTLQLPPNNIRINNILRTQSYYLQNQRLPTCTPE